MISSPVCLQWKRAVWVTIAAWLFAAPSAAPSQTTLVAAAAGVADNREPPALVDRNARYRILPGDGLELNFPLSHEFDQTTTVAPDGFISLRGVGDLQVGGLSLPELREALRKSYLPILNDPVITVELKDFQKRYFTVSGQVGHPGKFELREDVTVAEGLAIAGGTTVNAKSSQVLLFRRMPEGSMVEVKKLDMHKMMKKGDLREDMHLEPGDLLFVPQNAISKIERFLPTSSLGMYSTGIP